MWFVINKSAYLISHLHICSDWLKTKKANFQNFIVGFSDETLFVGSGGHKQYPLGMSSLNMHYKYLIYIF